MRACLLSLLGLALAAQTPTDLDAPIRRVRLHPDEAWVTRVGQVRITGAGTAKLVIRNLPPGLGLDDLRVSARGPEGSRLGDLAVSSEVRVVTETPEYKALLKEKEALRDRRDALEAEAEASQAEEAFLRNLQAAYDKDLSAKLVGAAPSSTNLLDLSRGLQGRLGELLTRDRRRQRELERQGQEEARLEAELAKQNAGKRVAPSRVSLELSTPRAGDAEVELSYRTRAARWAPAYEARLAPDRRKLELVLFAAITQRSGEDWDDVRLEISNAKASRSLAVPRFSGAQEVGWMPPAPPAAPIYAMAEAKGQAALAPGVVGGAAVQNTYVMDAASPAEEGGGQILEESQGLATTFQLEGTKEVPSDGEPHRFKVVAKDLDPELALVAAPRLDPTAYQVARFPTPAGLPLFPGAPIVQFAGTQRLGQTQLIVPAPGQKFELGFGPYRGARVSFARLEARKEQVGTFSKERQWTLRERMEATNDTAEALDLEVTDRILRSTVENLKISSTTDSTPGEERSPGVRSWTLHLGPRSTGTVQVGTVLRAPQEGFLTGLGGLGLPQ